MTALVRNWATLVWLIITSATALSWWLGNSLGTQAVSMSNTMGTVSLLLIAFFKVRLVIMYFMEARTAPLPLRLITEAWVIIACGATLTIYFVTGQGSL